MTLLQSVTGDIQFRLRTAEAHGKGFACRNSVEREACTDICHRACLGRNI